MNLRPPELLPILLLLFTASSIVPAAARAQQSSIESLRPMAPNADPGLEVVTVKPTDPDDHNQGFGTHGQRIAIENMTVLNMICYAFSVQNNQVVNAPKWLDEARWNVDGVPDQPGVPSNKQYQRLVQKLLADRFHLQFHREQRVLSVYALTVAKSGAKLKASASAPDAPIDQTGHVGTGLQYRRYTNNNMQDFLEDLQFILSRPVVNRTNLSGRYDFMLRWSDEMQGGTDPAATPGFFTAIQEQLGLKLEPTKAPVDVMTIDHIERPSEN